MRQITKVYIHCSYTNYGTVEDVRRWHMSPPNNWSDIGYHYCIHNAFSTEKEFNDFKRTEKFTSITDGEVVTGRPVSIPGAQVLNDNKFSIGACYIGIFPSPAQWGSLLTLCVNLIKKYPLLNVDSILGHHEYWKRKGEPIRKTCPNFCLSGFRDELRNRI